MKKEILVKNRGSVFVMALFVILVMTFTCHAGPPKPTGELSMAMAPGGFPEIFDPMISVVYVKSHISLLYDSLVGCSLEGSKLDARNGIAKKWDVSHSSDSTTYTFYLRKEIKFHNGDTLTAEDVKFSLERLTSKKAVASEARTVREAIKSIEIVDPYIVRITTKEPNFWLLQYLSPIVGNEGMVLPKKYIEEKGDEYFATHPIGSGPYKNPKLVAGSYILYEAVDDHWRAGPPKYKYVRFLMVPEKSTRVAMLKKGEVSIAAIGLDDVKTLEKEGFIIHEKPGALSTALWFAAAYRPDSPFANVKVRQAMNLGINRKEMLQYIFYGRTKLTNVWPAFSYSLGAIDIPPYPYDPEKAKRLLKEAGYPKGFEVNLYDIVGYPSEFRDMNTAIAAQWAKMGIKAKIISVEYTFFRAKLKAHELDPNDMLGVLALPPRVLAHGTIHALYHSKGVISMYRIPEFDALIVKLLKASTKEKYNQAMATVLRYMYDHYMTMPFGEHSTYYASSKEISDWKFNSNIGDSNMLYLTTRK